MIGPHQGKELELMLSGTKHLALFSDEVIAGNTISEEIIPDQAFMPYLNRLFVRMEKDIYFLKTKTMIRYVCFTTQGEEWRAKTIFWIKEEMAKTEKKFDPVFETMIGRLLGYTEEDIKDYIENFKSYYRSLGTNPP